MTPPKDSKELRQELRDQILFATDSQSETKRLMQLADSYAKEFGRRLVKAELQDIRDELPDPDNDSHFSPPGSGGWDLQTYKMAIADQILELDSRIAQLSQTVSKEE